MGLHLFSKLRRKALLPARGATNSENIENSDVEPSSEKHSYVQTNVNDDETETSGDDYDVTRCDLKENPTDSFSVSTASTMSTIEGNESRSEDTDESDKRHVEGDERRENIEDMLTPTPPVAPLRRHSQGPSSDVIEIGDDQSDKDMEESEMMSPVNVITDVSEDEREKPPLHQSRHHDDCDAFMNEQRRCASSHRRHRRSASDTPDHYLHIFHNKLSTLYEESVKSDSIQGDDGDGETSADEGYEGYEGSDDSSDSGSANECDILQARWKCALHLMDHSGSTKPSDDFYNTVAEAVSFGSVVGDGRMEIAEI